MEAVVGVAHMQGDTRDDARDTAHGVAHRMCPAGD